MGAVDTRSSLVLQSAIIHHCAVRIEWMSLKFLGAYWLRRVIDVRRSMPSFVRDLVKNGQTKTQPIWKQTVMFTEVQ